MVMWRRLSIVGGWVLAVALILIPALSSCGEAPALTDVPPQNMLNSGSWYARQAWPHDGQPVTTEHFRVYSDAAPIARRQEAADIAESLWLDLLDEFGVTEADLVFPEGQDRVDIYLYQHYAPERWGMRAYWGGFIAWSLDHAIRKNDPVEWTAIVEHELVHVIETLLKGRDSTIEPMVETWFSEGLGEAVPGGTSGGPILGRDQLGHLLDRYDGQNPIALKRDSMYDAVDEFHYPMFQLSVDWLLAPDGGGRDLEDVRDVFFDMRDGATFEEAFAVQMGTTVDTYEAEFFDLVTPWLPAHRNPIFTPVGVGIIVLVVLGSTIAVLVVNGRLHRRTADTRQRVLHHGSTTLGALVAAGATIALIILLGTIGALYNPHKVATRHIGHLVVIGFFIVSLAALVVVQRRWSKGSWVGYAGFPIVAGLFVATFATLARMF
jgi:hypothetical protein